MTRKIQTFEDAVSFLFSLSTSGIKLGLDTISTLTTSFNNPEKTYKTVLVAGTNGKGSVCAMLGKILSTAGYKTGIYTSPHLIDVRERIRINDDLIAKNRFTELLIEIKDAADRLTERGELDQYPTYFEFITTIAFRYFAEEGLDIAVLEVGLGGRFDAVNIVDPIISIITDVDLDHKRHLGKDLTQIAGEKAGIIRKSGTLITSVRQRNAFREINRIAEIKNSSVHSALNDIAISVNTAKADTINEEKLRKINPTRQKMENGLDCIDIQTSNILYEGIFPALTGRHQLRNISSSIYAAELLRNKGFDIHDAAIIEGIENASWPGRLEWIDWKIPLLIDGAHNPSGMRTLKDYVNEKLKGKRFDLIFAVKRSKDYRRMIEKLFLPANRILLPDMKKASFLSPEEITEMAHHHSSKIETYASIVDIIQAYKPDDVDFTLAAGSLYLIGNIKAHLEGSRRIP